ncbi:MAG: AAA family ATPase, partial [Anaerolineales bacterium]|nr:AAA family ATPase [Anaerolineales bacterium]
YLLTMGNTPADTIYIRQFVRNTGRERLWLIAGDRQTTAAQMMLQAMDRPISAARESLSRFLRNGLGYIILDTSPSLGGLQERALWAADLVLIPTAADYLSTDGVRQMVETLNALKISKNWEGTLLGILPTFVEDQVREHKAGLADLRELFSDRVLSPIHKAATLRECPGVGLTIFEKDAESRAAEEYRKLVKLVLKH